MLINGLLRKDNPFDYVVLGFIMKLLGEVAGFFISYHIADSVFGVLSWIFIIQGFTRIPGHFKFPFKGFYQFLLSFFLFQCLVMIIRGYLIDYNYIWFTTIGAINYHLFEPTYILCYLMPFAALIPIRFFNFRLLAKYSVIFALITVLMAIVYRNEIMHSSLTRAMGMALDENSVKAAQISFYGTFAFLPLLNKYLPNRLWRINLIGLIVSLLLVVIGARRGGVILTSMLLLCSLYFRAQSKSKDSKIIEFVLSSIMVAIMAYYVLQSVMASYLLERGFEDTRDFVQEAMSEQMSTIDWIFGKGLNGRYYCPLRNDDYLNGWRYGIETGFYNLVLKGGYLLAVTYVLLLVIPAYRGWFKSKNLFCKAGGFYLFYNIVSMWPFGILQFRLNFLIIWMIIVCCMNQKVLLMTDEEIKKQFFYNLK